MHTPPTPDAPANKAPGQPNSANSGHNDNPDEFSAFKEDDDENQPASGTENYAPEAEPADPADQPGHIEQNQDPAAVLASQINHADNETTHEAWAKDDPRYAGGGTHNTRNDEKNDQLFNDKNDK